MLIILIIGSAPIMLYSLFQCHHYWRVVGMLTVGHFRHYPVEGLWHYFFGAFITNGFCKFFYISESL